MTTIEHLSPSGVDTWTTCPDRWWWQYVERVPQGPPSEAMLRGTVVHRAVEALFPVGLVSAPSPLDVERTLADAYDEVMASAAPSPLTSGPAVLRASCMASLLSAVARLSNLDEVLLSEVEVRWADSPIPFYGRCDLVARRGDRVFAIDLKTGKPPERGTPWFDRTVAERMAQPAMYAYGLQDGARPPSSFGLLYCPPEGESELFLHDDLRPAVDEHRRVAAEIVDALEAGESPGPSPGPLCGWCPFVALCHAGQAEIAYRHAEGRNVGPAGVTLGLTT